MRIVVQVRNNNAKLLRTLFAADLDDAAKQLSSVIIERRPFGAILEVIDAGARVEFNTSKLFLTWFEAA